VLALAAFLGLTSAGIAGATETSVPNIKTGQLMDYNWILTPYYGAGQYDGTLRIKVGADGVISGYFQSDAGRFESLTGGITGDKIWLDFGLNGPVHVTGTVANGKITGYSWLEHQDFTFTASPVAPNP
jgi:hypothetical protein